MDPILGALLQSWNWRVDVILSLTLVGTIFVVGWQRIRNPQHKRSLKGPRPNRRYFATHWRLMAYLGGLLLIGIALMSPIDVLGGQ